MELDHDPSIPTTAGIRQPPSRLLVVAKFPALPLWTDAYLADTAARITAEEHGVYTLLMQLAWRDGNDTRLPPVDECVTWIKGVCLKMHGRTARRLVEGILERFWTQDENGFWYQKRLEKEMKHVRNTSEKRSKNARKRWAQSQENKDLADARADAPTPTPTPIKESLAAPKGAAPAPPKKARKPEARARQIGDWEPDDELRRWAVNKGLDRNEVRPVFDSFRDYWRGTGKPMKDWPAVWRNWVRKEVQGTFRPGKARRSVPAPTSRAMPDVMSDLLQAGSGKA